MHITVLQKHPHVNKYLYYGFILFLTAFQSVYTAQGQSTPKKEKTASTQQPQPQQFPVPSPSPSQTAIEQPQSTVQAEKSPEQQKTAFWDVKFTDWLQVGINVVLLIVVFWQARINRDQRVTLSKQNEIMEGQNAIMESQQQIMQGELDITRDAIKQSDRALLASEAQAQAAKDSVLIAQEAFYVGEGPYFG